MESVGVDKRLLHRIKLAVLGQALDRGHFAALTVDGQQEAGVHRAPVDEDGAGATVAHLTHFLGAGEAQIVAERVQERAAGFDGHRVLCPVDLEGERYIVHVGLAVRWGSSVLSSTAEGRHFRS